MEGVESSSFENSSDFGKKSLDREHKRSFQCS